MTPGMPGVESAAEARRLRPDLPIVLASGLAELSGAESERLPRLAKPFTRRPWRGRPPVRHIAPPPIPGTARFPRSTAGPSGRRDRRTIIAMGRAHAALLAAFAVTGAAPAFADSQMVQSPLLMRRAGPSCQPGDLGGDPGAGYMYRLGPCAGPYTGPSGAAVEVRRMPARRRRS